MSADLSKRAKEILETISYITIASVDAEGIPWNSPVFAVHDDEFNFYFGTYKKSQKALNINKNPQVFVVVYDSTAPPGTGEAVYIKATAAAVTHPDEIQYAHKMLWDGHQVPYWKLEEFSEPTPLILYRVTPDKVWMNDEGNVDGHYVDTRSEVKL